MRVDMDKIKLIADNQSSVFNCEHYLMALIVPIMYIIERDSDILYTFNPSDCGELEIPYKMLVEDCTSVNGIDKDAEAINILSKDIPTLLHDHGINNISYIKIEDPSETMDFSRNLKVTVGYNKEK